jgi:AbrB family looped-hinge helix DNA binding protein
MPTIAALIEVTVPEDGRVEIPLEVRAGLGLKPGDLVSFRIIGAGVGEMRVLGRMTLAEMVDRFPVDRSIDVATAITEGEAAAADEALDRMGLGRADG